MINISKLAAAAKATPKIETALDSSADKAAQEKMSRRAALRRIGMTGAMAVIGVMSIDDLARVSAKKLEEHEMTRGLAKDFKNAGVVFAQAEGGDYYDCMCQCDRTHTANVAACPAYPSLLDILWMGLAGYTAACTAHNVCVIAAATTRTNCYNGCP